VGTLAAGVAHEINNPLAYVCSNLTYLGEQLAGDCVAPEALPELRDVVAETQEGASRVSAIVQDLKTFARSDENRFGPVEVHQVIEGALRLVRNDLIYRARLERALEPVPPVRGNSGRLGQVVVNLLVNAIQALPKKESHDNRIRIATRTDGPDKVVVEVEDNGPGMGPEVIERIFDPFFTTKPVGVGTGLGLAICHSIVQSMDGHIEVRSTLGHGTLFRLVFPVYQQQVTAPALEDERAEAPAAEPHPASGPPVGRRLLLGGNDLLS